MELRGMYDDSLDKANHPQGTWSTNTRNIVITKDRKAISNEDGFAIYCPTYPEGAQPIGYCTLYNDEFVVISIILGYTEIARVTNDGIYNLIVRDAGFGFTENHPVTCTKQYNIKGELEVVFTDNNVVPYILNIDTLPFELDGAFGILPAEMINNARLFPEMILPEFGIEGVNSTGGIIDAGMIFFTGRYVDYNDAVTNFFPITDPVHIFNSTGNYNTTVGTKTLEKTSNSVSLSITNIDTRFKKIKLAVVKRINNQYYAQEFNEIMIDGPTRNIVYTGAEPATALSLSEVIVDTPIYNKVAHVLSNSDTLYLASVSAEPPINIQRYVNSWKVKYKETPINVNRLDNSHKDSKTIALKRPFMHNEVYDLYAVPVKNGAYGDAFHIPGREMQTITLGANVFNENALLTVGFPNSLEHLEVAGDNVYLYEDYSLAPEKVRYFQTRDTSKPDGTLGYWENQNEFYPNTPDWDIYEGDTYKGTLRNQKVRHHKTPTINKDDVNLDDATTHKHQVVYLEVSNINLPEEVWAKIDHIEIFYAKRTGGNSTLAGRSMLYFGSYNENDLGGFNGGNFDWFNTEYGMKVTTDENLRFHAFDMLVDKTNVLPTYVYNNYKITSQFYQALLFETDNNNDITYNSIIEIDTTIQQRNVYGNVARENSLRKLQEQQYLPYNTIITSTLSNRYNQESFYAKLATPGYMGLTMFELDHSTSQDKRWHATKRHEAYMSDLCVYREDCYPGFDKQELVATGTKITANGETKDIWGGDAFVGKQEYLLTAGNGFKHMGKESGITIVFYAIYNETANNTSLADNVYSNRKSEWFQIPMEKEFPIVYNKDYTGINSLNPVTPYNPNALVVENFPNRIMRSNRSNREEKVSSWRIFLPNNYFEASRDRGKIMNIEAINGEILIHHEYGLYITRGQDTLETDGATIEVGSGDIFAREPREILDSQNGYVGTQHKFSCHKFKGGYVSVDAKQGKVFIMDESLKEVSNEGMYGWFREQLIGATIEDNPFAGSGISSVYDEVNNRILISNSGQNPFTISYSLENKGWASFHDYTPAGIFATANRLISFKDGKIHLHNVKGVKGKYYNSTTYRSYIEMVVTDVLTKIYTNVIWKSQVTKNKVVNEREMLTHIMLYNHIQCSGEVPITYLKTTRNAEGLWKFNNFRDLVKDAAQRFLDDDGLLVPTNIDANKPFFKKSRIYGDYLCVRLIYDNLKQADIVISEFGVNNRVSPR